MEILQELRQQRWDDHRFYHQNRINQTLHLVSAMCFLASYVLIFTNPEIAVLIGWILAMLLRQAGHFFFEPKGFDEVNQTTHEYKESVKPGYNLKRKVMLLAIWAGGSIALYLEPSLWGLLSKAQVAKGFEPFPPPPQPPLTVILAPAEAPVQFPGRHGTDTGQKTKADKENH